MHQNVFAPVFYLLKGGEKEDVWEAGVACVVWELDLNPFYGPAHK